MGNAQDQQSALPLPPEPHWFRALPRPDTDKSLSQPVILPTGTYTNPWPTWYRKGFIEALKFMASVKWPKLPPAADLDKMYPVVPVMWDIIKSPNPEAIHATWIGHSTFLVQMEGVTFLTDPIWSSVASPVFVGPGRYRPPPFPLTDLPHVDFVLVSHDHYDHLDLPVVKHIGNKAKWIIPIGLAGWFKASGVTNVVELSWWQRAHVQTNSGASVAVYLTPTQHWSKRTALADMESLWGSFVVAGQRGKVFFCGDTGYCSAFAEIGRALGPVDLALLPIGAYCPREMMKFAHVNVEESVKIHQELAARQSIGMHFGTYLLTVEPIDEPPQLLRAELEKQRLDPNSFVTIRHGETLSLPLKPASVIVPAPAAAAALPVTQDTVAVIEM